MRRATLLALVAFVAASCGKTTAKQATVATGGPQACPPFAETTAAKSGTSKPEETLLLIDVAVDREVCADRVVFTFRSAADEPGYHVEYRPAEEAQTEDGSGRHIDIAGNAFLVVRFEPAATADLSGAKLERTYTGPRTITPNGMRFVQQISKVGDFEAVLAWTIGLSQKRPFKVTSAGSPPRLTIELG
jgi:hypothetical protein